MNFGNENHRSILDAMPHGCQIVGFDWCYRYINVTAERHNGRPNADLLGLTVMECWPGITQTRAFALAKNCMEKRTTHRLDDEFVFPDGRRGWYRLTIQPNAEGIVIFSEDISARKKTDENLRWSEELLVQAQAIAHLGSWELDLIENRLTWSDEVYRIFGLQPQEFAATYEAFLDRVHPDDLVKVDDAYTGSLRENRDVYEVEHRIVRKDNGEIRFVHERCLHFRDTAGRIIRSVGMVHDMTERKRREDELRESKERLKLFIDFAPAGLAMLDRDMRYLFLNRRWREAYGLEGRNLLGVSHYDVFPEVSAQWKEAHRRGLAGEVLKSNADRFERADGSVHWLRWEIRPWFDSKGELGGIVIFAEDITERVEAEEHIRQLNDELEQRVKERTAELEVLNNELESFCYSVSHDLRAPLRGLSGFASILQEDYHDKLDEAGKKYLNRIQTAALSMGQLIDALLNLSRVSRVQLCHEKVNISELAKRIAKTLSEYEPERNVAISVQEEISANGDPNLIRIVLTNLLGNAWKYTKNKAHPEIEFGKCLIDGESVYFVHDNGAGFNLAHAPLLFKPFHRLHGIHDFEGNGIGLATVERIISRHGGKVWAEGEVDKGATFYFTLSARACSKLTRS